MSKLRCMAHGERVHVLHGALTVHRSNGARCVINPTLTIAGKRVSPSKVVAGNAVKNA